MATTALTLLAAFLAAGATAAGDPPALSGLVREAGVRAPVAAASVLVVETNAAAETAADGTFAVAVPSSGSITLRVVAAGFEPYEVKVPLPRAARLDVYLRRAAGGFETTVSGRRKKEDQFEKTLNAEEVRSIPGTMGDPLRSVQSLPGVARAGYVGGAISVRGSNPVDTGFYVDGRPIPVLYHFADGPTVVNSEVIDRLRFMPGGYPPELGRTTSGIIELQSRRGVDDRLHLTVKADLFDLAAFAEGPIAPGTTFMAGVRRSHLDALMAAFTDQASKFSVLPRYYDYQLKVNFPLPGARGASVFALGSDDAVAVSGFPFKNQFSHTADFHRLLLDATFPLPGGARLVVQPTLGYDYNRDAQSGRLVGAVTLLGGARVEAIAPIAAWLDTAVGADVQVKRYDFRLSGREDADFVHYPTPGDIYSVPYDLGGVAWERDASVYLRADCRPVPSVSIIPGVRLDGYWFEDAYLGGVDPRIQARWRAVPWMTLKATWGIYRAMPQPYELSREAGNPALGLERSDQVGAGAEFTLPWGIEADVQGYYKTLSDLIVRSNNPLEIGGTIVRERYANEGAGRSYGMELFVHQRVPGRSFGWISYTLSKSERNRRGDDELYLFALDQPHILNVIYSRHVVAGFYGGFRFRLTSGNPYTPVIGATLDADANRYAAFRGAASSERLPLYHQLDLRLEKSFVYDEWILNVYVDLMNVYNQRNYEYYMYDYDYRRIIPIEGLPFLPSFGVMGKF